MRETGASAFFTQKFMLEQFSILIGGNAGDGIDSAGLVLARILTQFGFHIYVYRDYPSLIRGGHTFSIIRVSRKKIAAHSNRIDFLLALQQDCIDLHKDKIWEQTGIIYNSDLIKNDSLPLQCKLIPVPLENIIKEEKAMPVIRNACMIGAFCKALGISKNVIEYVFKKSKIPDIEMNILIASLGFESAGVFKDLRIENVPLKRLPLLSGNEIIALGLVKAGLQTYISYPMTPSSGILHFLAKNSDELGCLVIHPENEIAVILMALGCSYAGNKAAVGTSGGGFCLMTEGLSLSGMAEIPLVIVVGQRPGPSTGLPTYSSQTELNFVLNAGQGEFPRFVVAPGDAEEAYFWSGMSLAIAWKYQIPAIILSDKTLAEGVFSFDNDSISNFPEITPVVEDSYKEYKRYENTESGVSPLAFISRSKAVIKVNSYEHDEYGITTEDPSVTMVMQHKRLRKEKLILHELEDFEPVGVYGNRDADTALICWGSNKGVCCEVGEALGIKIIQPRVLAPFPVQELLKACSGVTQCICVENNALGQLACLCRCSGIRIDDTVLRYDGRPFSIEELTGEIQRIIVKKE